MFYVYLIQSEAFPEQRYVGYTTDLKKRIDTYKARGSVHLKSGSGRAFAHRRLW
jgi:predicted GIY-YIG superfamily endonuclease